VYVVSTPPNTINVLPPPPTRTPVTGDDGLLSAPWTMYFNKLSMRVGGGFADTLGTIATGLTTAQTSLTALNSSVGTITTSVNSLQVLTAAQQLALNVQQSQIAGVQTVLAPGLMVTITTAALTAGGTQGSMTFNSGVLTAQVAAT
jgi:hypothetical protein